MEKKIRRGRVHGREKNKGKEKKGGGGDEKVASNISVRRIKSKDHLKLTGSQ